MNHIINKPKLKIFQSLLELFPNDSTSTIILEQPELLFSLVDGLTSDELNELFIKPLAKRCGLLIITTSVDLYQKDYSMTKDVTEFMRFINSCFHISIAVLSLQPLETGRAKDITGSLKITRGGATSNHLSTHVVENEYLYLNEKDSTKLFY